MMLNRLITFEEYMKIKFVYNTFRAWMHRDRLTGWELVKVVEENFKTSMMTFRGFFGEPYCDYGLLTASKTVLVNDEFQQKFKDCEAFINQLGWQFHSSKDGEYAKIQMIPKQDIIDYMRTRITGEKYAHKAHLYAKYSKNPNFMKIKL